MSGDSKDLRVQGRTLWVNVNIGPVGSPGETYDLDTEESRDTTERQALLSGLRGMFVIPAGSFYGLLFIERAGRRHLEELLHTIAVKPTGSSIGAVMRLVGFAELEDWGRELAPLTVLRVSELLAKRERGHDDSTADDTTVTISAEGGQVRRVSDRVKALLGGRIERRDARLDVLARVSELGERRREAKADGVAFMDEEEFQAEREVLQGLNPVTPAQDEQMTAVVDGVVPVDRQQLEHRRFDLTLGDTRPQRNITIEASGLPQFVYELGERRLNDGALRNSWTAHAETILRSRGVELPADWSVGRRRGSSR